MSVGTDWLTTYVGPPNGDAGTLRLGFAASSAVGLLSKIVRRFREEVPGVILELDDRDGVDVSAAIRRGELDIAIVRYPLEAPDLDIVLIHEEPFIVAMPADHALASCASMIPVDLAGNPFVLFPRAASPGLHDTIIGMCIRAGFSPQIIQEASAWLSIMGLVESGIGITIAPKSAQSICPPAIVCRPIVGTDDRARLVMATRRNVANPLIKRFQDVARSSIELDL